MAVQSAITEYFIGRKRPAIDDEKRIGQPSKKLMILEKIKSDVSDCPELNASNEDVPGKDVQLVVRRKLVYNEKQSEPAIQNNLKSSSKSRKYSKVKVTANTKSSVVKQSDIRKTFSVINRSSVSKGIETPSSEIKASEENKQATAGIFSGLKKNVICSTNEKPQEVVESTLKDNKQVNSDVLPKEVSCVLPDVDNKKVTQKTNDERATATKRVLKDVKELNLDEIRSKIKKSSRSSEIKKALNKLNEGFSKLEQLREKRISTEAPSIKKFDTVTFDVLLSPPKTPVKITSGMSPAKLREAVFKSPGGRTVNMDPVYVSPRKLFDMQSEPNPLTSPTKPPAFQRYKALATEGRSTLPLPFKYRSLAEVFRGIETVVSMMHNRGETVTFVKLKAAVQELVRRNLYEKHLGQIKTVFDDAFEIYYEKVHTFGKHQPDRYDLIIKPVLKDSNSNPQGVMSSEANVSTKLEMSPDVLLNRRRIFYKNLLDKTKLYHEKFLLSLDPPIHVNKDSITRWHPEFDVDGVPDVEASPLPEPPNVQKAPTAKDVLERARNLFSANPRLDNALQKLTEQSKETSCPTTISATTNTGPAIAALNNALKGLPKSLLEKVRAKQAAKALEAMTRSPSQAKEAVRLTRLPELARIVRNIFISEKKSVLTRELVIKKLADSYRENLSFSELNIHLDLLQQKTPEWLSFCTLRKTNFVKFVKDADMSRIMTQLETIASENNY